MTVLGLGAYSTVLWTTMTSVLLLRAASRDVPDKYESSFVAAGYVSTSIPVLETNLTNTNELARVLSNDTGTSFSGVIFTSARACEAWKNASDLVAAPSLGLYHTGQAQSLLELSLARWCALPFYVVGKSTASTLRELDHAPKDIRGEDSGNAEQLARYILNDTRQMSGKLLYLTGDKNRDTLPSILASGGLALHQIQVYETRGSARFATDLVDVLSKGTDGRCLAPNDSLRRVHKLEQVTIHGGLSTLPHLRQNSSHQS